MTRLEKRPLSLAQCPAATLIRSITVAQAPTREVPFWTSDSQGDQRARLLFLEEYAPCINISHFDNFNIL